MKKLILLAAWVLMHAAVFAEPAAQKSAAVSNFANANNVFMIIEIALVAAFVLIPVYSLSRAVSVLAKKVSEK